jgi:hypothetical protein
MHLREKRVRSPTLLPCEFVLTGLTFSIQGLYSLNYMFCATHNATAVMAMCMCTRVGLWVERRSGNKKQ